MNHNLGGYRRFSRFNFLLTKNERVYSMSCISTLLHLINTGKFSFFLGKIVSDKSNPYLNIKNKHFFLKLCSEIFDCLG